MPLRSTLRFGLGVVNLWPFLPLASRAPLYGRLIVDLVRDSRVPWSRKALLGVAAVYVASPVDVIPDVLPLVSRLDDAAIVILALDIFLDGVPRQLMIEKMHALGIDGRELERDLEAARRLMPAPLRAAARRLPAAIEMGAAFIHRELVARGVIEPDKHGEAYSE